MVMIDNFGSVSFLWFYMLTIWISVLALWKKKPMEKNISWIYLYLSFLLLAFGDIFHLVPRTFLWIAYRFYDRVNIYDSPIGIKIYGFGQIMTGITMIFFYLGFYLFWKKEILSKIKSQQKFSVITKNLKIFDSVAYISVIVRIILILMPWNNWGSTPIYYSNFWNFRLLTNLPLYIIGFEVLFLFLGTNKHLKGSEMIHLDLMKAIKYSGYWIIFSFLTYTITILGAHSYPLLGLMMIPKTIAYLFILRYMGKYVLGNPAVLSKSTIVLIE